MDKYQDQLALAGRVLLSALMFYAALFNIFNWSEQVELLVNLGVPLPGAALFGATATEIVLGVPLVLGYQTRWVALLLAFYTLACALLLHQFWAAPPSERASVQMHFAESIAAVGGLLTVAAFGPGRLSIDARQGRVDS